MSIDLHCHSHFSDGSLAPAELVLRAVEQGVSQLAITDHDSVAGLAQAQQTIVSQQLPLRLVSGVEISCRWHRFDIHIVGLNIDPQQPTLLTLLAQQQQARQQRIAAMLEKLARRGMDVSTYLQNLSGVATRKHIADALVAAGHIDQPQQAFKRYIGAGKSAYQAADWCTIDSAISAIHAAGGVAVLAHPHAYQLSNKWLRRLLLQGKSWQLDAIEVAISQQSPGQREALQRFALEYDYYASAGSDFHNPNGWRELGKNLCLPADCVPIWQHWAA
ncbi:PHP domain-containing protein [Idiomarina xiamenensis]|uniref:Metal-dependent phosphoesterase n=1 Tax=Idiomarina xiamenensis 10-D-4 TaxID=740709 RepID=K2KCE5_9GAMM|nr:PHP domain-containing protein [Idiomarina xiamenensis]EKE84307.1 metal-dependent phosphoesterase [Idiomarina xiamenensis 10-D-4]